MKKVLPILLLLSCLLSACPRKPDVYPFPNRSVPVKSIALIQNCNPGGIGIDEEKMVILRTLAPSEFSVFMDGVYALPTKRCGTPPPYGYGEYIAKVTYENGDVEIFGSENIVWIPMGESSYGVGEYFFAGDSFKVMFSQYVDITVLPEPPVE